MSQPLMVEAIEELFIPVLVYNNTEEDAALLKSFDEPSWNNPVVRFLDADGKDVIERKDGVWTTGPLANRMIASLNAANQEIPTWLGSVASSCNEDTQKFHRASFAML